MLLLTLQVFRHSFSKIFQLLEKRGVFILEYLVTTFPASVICIPDFPTIPFWFHIRFWIPPPCIPDSFHLKIGFHPHHSRFIPSQNWIPPPSFQISSTPNFCWKMGSIWIPEISWIPFWIPQKKMSEKYSIRIPDDQEIMKYFYRFSVKFFFLFSSSKFFFLFFQCKIFLPIFSV